MGNKFLTYLLNVPGGRYVVIKWRKNEAHETNVRAESWEHDIPSVIRRRISELIGESEAPGVAGRVAGSGNLRER